jgi:hypothetical protein
MTRSDKVLLAGLLLLSLLSMAALYSRFSPFYGSITAIQTVISVQGTVVRTISMPVAARKTFVVPGRVGPSTVEIEGGRVRMQEAPCAGRICVNQGWIRHPGQSIACVPGEILIRIEGASPLDGVTR